LVGLTGAVVGGNRDLSEYDVSHTVWAASLADIYARTDEGSEYDGDALSLYALGFASIYV
jgi:hypothetical protein